MSLWDPDFSSFGNILRSGTVESYDGSISNYPRNLMLFPTAATPIYMPTHSAQASLFSTSSPTFLTVFNNSHSDRCERISHWF